MKALLLIFFLPLLTHASERPEAIAYYSNGSLLNGAELPVEGEGFMRLYLEHKRGFATEDMIKTITDSAAQMWKMFPDRGRLQVEDIAQEGGGKMDRHGSHQNGLDADLTYFRVDGKEHVPTPEQKFSPSMVLKKKPSPNFDTQRNWEFMKALHRSGRVNRIFVDQVLKDELCRYAKKVGELKSHEEVLRSLRHETNHHDHLHVRLHCPALDTQCQPQSPPPAGSGCPKRL